MNGNLLSDISPDLPEELVEVLAEGREVTIERIVSRGHCSPNGFWYDQPRDEFVVLVSGRARLAFERDGRRQELEPGDFLVIPARERHRVEWTAPDCDTVWLAIHF
jgi:cupin 2 domain-containing protein